MYFTVLCVALQMKFIYLMSKITLRLPESLYKAMPEDQDRLS